MPPKDGCRRKENGSQARATSLDSYSTTKLGKHSVLTQLCSNSQRTSLSYQSASSSSLDCACSYNQVVSRICRHDNDSDDNSEYCCDFDFECNNQSPEPSCKCGNPRISGPQSARQIFRPPEKPHKLKESLPHSPTGFRCHESVKTGPQVREACTTASPHSKDAATSNTPKCNTENKRFQCDAHSFRQTVATEAVVSQCASACLGTDDGPITTLEPKKVDKIVETKSLKFGQVLNGCMKEIGVECNELCPMRVPEQKEGCDCTFPPAFNHFACTGNIMGNCRCGKS